MGNVCECALCVCDLLNVLQAGPAITQGLSAQTQRALASWLGVCTAWVGSLVVLGGLTRLTRSGLSMTDWKFTGEAPPHSQVDTL